MGLGDIEKIGLDLETTVDRDTLGLQWNAPLPKGGFALGKDVTISVTLELALPKPTPDWVRILGIVARRRRGGARGMRAREGCGACRGA